MDIRILSVPFLGVTMMGAVTGAMIPCSLALIAVGKRDCERCVDAEWVGII